MKAQSAATPVNTDAELLIVNIVNPILSTAPQGLLTGMAQRLLRTNPAVQYLVLQPHPEDVVTAENALLGMMGGPKAAVRGMTNVQYTYTLTYMLFSFLSIHFVLHFAKAKVCPHQGDPAHSLLCLRAEFSFPEF